MQKVTFCFFVFLLAAVSIHSATHSAWSSPIPWDGPVGVQRGAVSVAPVSGLSVTPNPAALGTDVAFRLQGQLAAPPKASLGVYALSGSLLKSLPENGLRSGGSVAWNQTDNQGQAVAAGIYLVRLKTGNQSFECKLLLTK